MEVKAVTKFLRISARKTRLVADMVRGRNALEASQLLNIVNKRAAKEIARTLNSAISNAKQKDLNEESLWIKRIFIDGGPTYKRYMPRAMGRATMIKHPTSHITVILGGEENETKAKKAEKKIKKEAKKPVKVKEKSDKSDKKEKIIKKDTSSKIQ